MYQYTVTCNTVDTSIKKGDKFVCTSDVVMEGSNKVAYHSGHLYVSDHPSCITDNQGDEYHRWTDEWTNYFEPYQEKHCCNPCDCRQCQTRGKDYFDSVREENPYSPSNPTHYKGKIECIDVIAEVTEDLEGYEAFLTGTIIKYLYRWKRKNGLEDLEKASVYLEWLKKHILK